MHEDKHLFKRFPCKYCGLKFATMAGMRIHRSTKHYDLLVAESEQTPEQLTNLVYYKGK